MQHDEAQLLKALEETRFSGRCIADIARERGLKPQKLYALRYRTKHNASVITEEEPIVSKNNIDPNAECNRTLSKNTNEEDIMLEFNGFKIIFGPTVSARRVASIVAALKSEKSG